MQLFNFFLLHRNWLVIALLLIPVLSSANAIDSLKQAIIDAKEKEDPYEEVALYLKLGKVHYDSLDFEAAITTYQLGINLAKKYELLPILFELYSDLGNAYYFLDDYGEALANLRTALSIEESVEEIPISKVSHNYSRLAQVNVGLGEYEVALQYQIKALELSEREKDTIQMANSYSVISRIHWFNEKFPEALKANQKVLDLLMPDKAPHLIYHMLAARTSLNIQLDSIKNARYFAERSLAYADSMKLSYGEAFSTGLLGEVARMEGDLEEAERLVRKAISLFEEKGIQYEALDFTKSLAIIIGTMGNYQAAIKILEKALTQVQLIQLKALEKDIYQLLSQYYFYDDNSEKAYQNLKKYTLLKDSLQNAENEKRMISLQKNYKLEKQEQQIDLLEQAHKAERMEMYILISSLSVGFLLFISYLLFSRYRTEARSKVALADKNMLIADRNEQLASKNADMYRMAQLVSRDLQGPIKSIKRNLRFIRSKENLQQDQQSASIVQQIDSDIQMVSQAMEGLLLYSVSSEKDHKFELISLSSVIIDAINLLPEEYRQFTKKIHLHDLPQIYADKKKITQLFYYLLSYIIELNDELNLEVFIRTEISPDAYRISVANNGKGIPHKDVSDFILADYQISQNGHPQNEVPQVGLVICKEIIEQHNGNIQVKSELNVGPVIIFELPRRRPIH